MGVGDGRVVGVGTVINNGSTASRWNLVILAEGYTTAALPQFHVDAKALADQIMLIPPFTSVARAINVLRIDVESNDAGADDPSGCPGGSGARADTYFDATFCGSGIERLLAVDRKLAKATLNAHTPYWHAAIVLVNSTKYGGSGYFQIAVCSKHAGSVHIAVHELGHSVFGLYDEYNDGGTGTRYPAGNEPGGYNVTIATTRASLKWSAFVQNTTPIPTHAHPACGRQGPPPPVAGPVGTYEGGDQHDCDVYRPSTKCKMNQLQDNFCVVCSDRIRQTLAEFMPRT